MLRSIAQVHLCLVAVGFEWASLTFMTDVPNVELFGAAPAKNEGVPHFPTIGVTAARRRLLNAGNRNTHST